MRESVSSKEIENMIKRFERRTESFQKQAQECDAEYDMHFADKFYARSMECKYVIAELKKLLSK